MFLRRRPAQAVPALLGLWLGCLTASARAAGDEPLPAVVQFNRDIRPILAENCFQCHGPDKARRKADLRLDLESSARADRGGYSALISGDLEQSELYQRITDEDEEVRMPPPQAKRTLNPQQVALIGRWIEQGAHWQKHWSLLPPERPVLPDVQNEKWVRNPIDRFVLDRLEREGLAPAPEAEKQTLIRRVSLDLTGLPPTLAEIDAFLADPTEHADEKVVDRLLASPRFGERMAVPWLDAARYADTNGYQSDGERFMWRWRDWVIEAFNANKPFDQFTIEQLAGDLLPGATLDQQIATGFNRNHRGNAEGGIIPEEYAAEYVVDRVGTTATVWLGLTLGCARCHDHKFDPVTQEEFYRLFAYFNNVPEKGRAVKFGNSPPLISAPTRKQQTHLAELERRLSAAEARFESQQTELARTQEEWEANLSSSGSIDGSLTRGLLAHYPFDGSLAEEARQAKAGTFVEGSAVFAEGRFGQAVKLAGGRYVDAGDVGHFGFDDAFSIGVWVRPESRRSGTLVSRMTDMPEGDGYSLELHDGKLQLNLVKRWLDDALRVETAETVEAGRWSHVMATYDGSRLAEGVKVYIDGRPAQLVVLLDELNQSFQTNEPLRIGAGGGPKSRFEGLLDDVRIYKRALTAEEAALVATPETVSQIAAVPAGRRTPGQAYKIRSYFLEHAAPEPIQAAFRQVADLRAERQRLVKSFPTTMVMQEMPTPRPSHVLLRGEYDKPGKRVEPGVPACLPPLPNGAPGNRLGLARWLVDPANPLPARVAVNRFWQMLFGTGIVKTVDDFGSQGEWPTHPELLDWLATEFVSSGWDVKYILKTMVTSATYRQSSRAGRALLERDPENRLLARGPRVRLPAEMVRDQALAASGLLVERIGGPSVKPYQPEGLWKELAEIKEYPQDHGPNLYRRSLYTFWKRTVPPPAMVLFDAAGRESCTVRETRTNTPLQALDLMNDVTYVEASRALAERVLTEGDRTPEARLTLAFRLATARRPRPEELKVLVCGLRRQLREFEAHPEAARELVLVGESPPPKNVDVPELAAYTAVSSLILNLDEVVTKP